MRYLIAAFIIVGLAAPAAAALPNPVELSSIDTVGRWIANYQAKPTPGRLPAAVWEITAEEWRVRHV